LAVGWPLLVCSAEDTAGLFVANWMSAKVIRYKGDPAASSAMSAVTPKAEVNSERRVNPNSAAR